MYGVLCHSHPSLELVEEGGSRPRHHMIIVRVEGGDLASYCKRSSCGTLVRRCFTSRTSTRSLLCSKGLFSLTTSLASTSRTNSNTTPMLFAAPIVGLTLHSSHSRLAKSESTNSTRTCVKLTLETTGAGASVGVGADVGTGAEGPDAAPLAACSSRRSFLTLAEKPVLIRAKVQSSISPSVLRSTATAAATAASTANRTVDCSPSKGCRSGW
mmetsp:Transcript_45754/g.97580  ORF Transcript_45754/g.97580 Transcript_45754/m.97580 type:complete len:213 (-) Transcript_45754:333-971(-)